MFFCFVFEQVEFTTNEKSLMLGSPAQQPCKNFMHPVCTTVFQCQLLTCHHSISVSNSYKYCS